MQVPPAQVLVVQTSRSSQLALVVQHPAIGENSQVPPSRLQVSVVQLRMSLH